MVHFVGSNLVQVGTGVIVVDRASLLFYFDSNILLERRSPSAPTDQHMGSFLRCAIMTSPSVLQARLVLLLDGCCKIGSDIWGKV